MSKRLGPTPIFVAPDMKGYKEDGVDKVIYIKDGEVIDLNPNDIDAKIMIYNQQVNEWFLSVCNEIIDSNNTGFISLMVCLSYVEGVEQYRRGESSYGKSREFFREGIKRIINDSELDDNKIDRLYSQARCGMFHNGMTDYQVLISNRYNKTLDFSESHRIKINVKLLLRDIMNDFSKYIIDLGNDDTLRSNFNLMFSVT